MDNMKWNFEKLKNIIKTEDWFFPSDIIPHSTAFKYACNKFSEQGLLEKRGDKRDRWGYQYKVKPAAQESDTTNDK
jgi:hypothetical protein